MLSHRHWLTAFALLALVSLATQATAGGGSLIGKWRLGNVETEATLTLEFSSGGVVIFNDQVGTYWTSGSNVTVDGWNGAQVTMTFRVEGLTLYLTDPKGEQLVFQKVKY